MSNGLNIFTSLSSVTWTPIDFYLDGDDFGTKCDYVLFSNEMSFNLHEVFKNCLDISFNNKAGIFLTDLKYNTKILSYKKQPSSVSELTTIESPIGMYVDGDLRILRSRPFSSEEDLNGTSIEELYRTRNAIVLYNTNETYFNSAYLFTFNFIGGNLVKVLNHDKKALTSHVIDSDIGLTFNNEIFPPDDTQVFEYILHEDKICLFLPDSNYGVAVHKNPTGNNFILKNIDLGIDSNFPDEMTLVFVSHKKVDLKHENCLTDSFLVKYNTNLIQSQSVLDVNEGFSNTNLYSQNYLGMFPVENPVLNSDGTYSYLLNIHGLKNYQTPEYDYTIANPLTEKAPSIRRIYNKIFSGTNQKKGYDKLYLGYQSDTKISIFPQGTETPFYFPSVSIRTPISAAGLIEDGAAAGEVPYTSDRIYMYRMNYEEANPGQPSPESIKNFDRSWACAWLSGTNSGEKVWMDRYYNAAFYTLDQALSSKTHVYNEKTFPEREFTFDVPSTMYLEPGVLYKYDRVGPETSKKFIKFLDSDKNLEKGANTLSLTDWVSSPIVVDNSNYKNNAIIFYNTNGLNFNKTYWTLDGTSHAIIPPSKELLGKGNMTVSLWLSVDDWSDIYGEQIFGNYFESGFGLINQGISNVSMFTIVNTTSSITNNFNYKFGNLGEGKLEVINDRPKYEVIHRLPNYNYWVFDLKNKHAVLMNAFNNVMDSFSFHDYISFAHQVELDSEYNIYVYDNTFKMYSKFNSKGAYKGSVSFGEDSGYQRIEIDLNNNVVGIYGYVSAIDNKNNVWEVIGGSLYRNRELYALVGNTHWISVDSKNNIWIAHYQDLISKLNTTERVFEFSQRVGRGVTQELDPCFEKEWFRVINFVRVPIKGPCDLKAKYQDNLIIFDRKFNEMFRIGENGEYISRLDLQALSPNIPYSIEYSAIGDFTGYQFLRKFSANGANGKSLAWKLKIAHPSIDERTIRFITLTHQTSTLPPGWHHFCFVFDGYSGAAKYYIDSTLVDIEYFNAKEYEIVYDYRTSILIGAASLKNTTINDIIGLDDFNKFYGNVGDIKMYANALTTGEIEQIYFASNFVIPRPDLIWNRRVGFRSFIEQIEHWHKAQVTGSKSKYFNISIHNLNIDNDSKKLLEDAIRSNIKKIIPAHSSLYKINWK